MKSQVSGANARSLFNPPDSWAVSYPGVGFRVQSPTQVSCLEYKVNGQGLGWL